MFSVADPVYIYVLYFHLPVEYLKEIKGNQ